MKDEYTHIYTIADEFGYIRYVGKSNNLKARLKAHIKCKSNMHKFNWLNSIINRNAYPIIEIIETVNIKDWQESEIYWISQFRYFGFNLLNLTIGGDGGNGFKHSNISKLNMSIAKKGRKLSKETTDKISKSIKDLNSINSFYNRGVGNSRIILNREELYEKYILENLSLNKCATHFKVSKKTIFTNITEYGFKKERSTWEHQLSTRPKKSVLQYDTDYNLIKEFGSVSEASKVTIINLANISKCCQGKAKSAGGFIWQFKN